MTPTVTQDRLREAQRPRAAPLPAATDQRALDETIRRLQEGARRFVSTLARRTNGARPLDAERVSNIAERSVRAACAAKGIPLGTPLEGEEWTLGPWHVMRHLRLLIESLPR